MTSLRRLLGATAGLLVLTTAPWTVTDASAAPPAPARTASRAPILRADYRFADVRASSLPGAPDLTDIGGTNTFTAATIDGTEREVLRFGRNHGVALTPTTSVMPSGNYTVVVLAELDAVSGYRRLLDLKNGTTDSGLYVSDGYLYFYGGAHGTDKAVRARRYTQVVLTRNATSKLVTGYVDGKQQLTFTDTDGAALLSAKNTLRLFRDNTSSGESGEAAPGSIARLRVYDGALTATQVAALDREPS